MPWNKYNDLEFAAEFGTEPMVPAYCLDAALATNAYLERENRDLRRQLRDRERIRRLKWPVWVMAAWAFFLTLRSER